MRDGYLDAVRVLGIVAVVLGHVEGATLAHAAVYPWHVPLFFVLSGWFWRVDRSLAEEVGHRWRTLALPYLSWWIVVTLIYVTVTSLTDADIVQSMIGPLAGGAFATQPYSAFWFISALAVSTVVARAIAALSLPFYAQFLVGLLLCGMVQLFADLAASSPWAVAQGLGCVLFVQIGMFLRRMRPTLLTSAVMLAAGVALAALPWVSPLDIKVANFGTPILSLAAAVLICSGVVAAPVQLGGREGLTASKLAGAGLAVILSHALLLWLLTDHLPIGVVTLLAVVAPWALGLSLARTELGTVFGCNNPTVCSADTKNSHNVAL